MRSASPPSRNGGYLLVRGGREGEGPTYKGMEVGRGTTSKEDGWDGREDRIDVKGEEGDSPKSK